MVFKVRDRLGLLRPVRWASSASDCGDVRRIVSSSSRFLAEYPRQIARGFENLKVAVQARLYPNCITSRRDVRPCARRLGAVSPKCGEGVVVSSIGRTQCAGLEGSLKSSCRYPVAKLPDREAMHYQLTNAAPPVSSAICRVVANLHTQITAAQ